MSSLIVDQYTFVQFIVLFVTALLIGMSKTGIQGITLFVIPLMAFSFGAKASTGVILPMLCFADLIAVWYYRRSAEWKYILKLLPAAIAGFFLAIGIDKIIPPAGFRHLMAVTLLIGVLILIWTRKQNVSSVSSAWWYAPFFGLLGGFTTMIGNAAGPVMAVYLLSMRLPKYSFVGTSAWFFLVVNYLKLPLQLFVWENITMQTLILNLFTIPIIIVGAVIGIWFVKKVP